MTVFHIGGGCVLKGCDLGNIIHQMDMARDELMKPATEIMKKPKV
jgi:hypothetical protein